MSRLAVPFAACLCLLAAGFSSWPGLVASLSSHLVAPSGSSPLLPRERIKDAHARLTGRSGFVETRGGVAVFWRALDPGDYGLRYDWHATNTAGVTDTLDFALDFSSPATTAARPRGTVVLLHGWMMDGGSLLPWSLQLAEAGYRTIAIDLRNHGRSGTAPAGYGTREADDLVDVVARLRSDGEIVGPLHLFGVSYGAATALFAAADPALGADRVVALESFDNAGDAIRDMVPHMLEHEPGGWHGRLVQRWLRWRVDAAVIDAAVARAGETLHLSLDTVTVADALARTDACVLLVHGDADRHVPVAHGRALAAAAPQARYLELSGEDHLSLPMRLDRLGPMVVDWLDSPTCPDTTLVTREGGVPDAV